MLVLTRKVGEGIRFELNGIEYEVIVMQIKGKQVRLGLKAPKAAEIHRMTVEGELEVRSAKIVTPVEKSLPEGPEAEK